MGVDHRMMDQDERAALLAALLRMMNVEHRIVVVGAPQRKSPKDWSPRGRRAVPVGVIVQVREAGGWIPAEHFLGA